MAKRQRVAQQPDKRKGRGAAAVAVIGGAAAGGLLLWWLLRNRPTAEPPPADPVVDVGDDQAVTLDLASRAEIVINFSVTADNPVNLVWTRTSGPAPVAFSPLGPNQELAEFQTPGAYLLRLTATDATDGRAHGFDELVVTVNEVLLAAILVPGELKVDGFASYTLTRSQGDTISFVWPVQNVGELAGAAFIQLTEGGAEVGTGAAFQIDPGRTVNVNFNPVVSLAPGVHILVASIMEGLPPNGIPVGSSQIITLTVVSIPVLSAVGVPAIDGIVGATSITVVRGILVSVNWAVRNDGGAAGRARLRSVSSPLAFGISVVGGLITIPGNSTVTLLLGLGTGSGLIRGFAYNITITMEDEVSIVLGSWSFTLLVA